MSLDNSNDEDEDLDYVDSRTRAIEKQQKLKVEVMSAGYFTVFGVLEVIITDNVRNVTGMTKRLKADPAVRAALPAAMEELAEYVGMTGDISPMSSLLISTALVAFTAVMAPEPAPSQEEVEDEEPEFVDE